MQTEVINFLKSPNGHPGRGQVEVVETHGALVFLAGDVALKMKRAVRYDYMDLSTLDLREAMLRRELELNKPVAPKIYQKVVAVTRASDGSLALDGPGKPVEWILRMWRFPAKAELAVIAENEGINDTLAHGLGSAIFDLHKQSPKRNADGAVLIRDILDELDHVFADMTDALGPSLIEAFHTQSRQVFWQTATRLQHRAKAGQVRRCHGDLHLRNLVLLDGKPVPFDALEFDEVLGTCDVLYDLAYLIMDLRHRGLGRAANMALNAYLLAASGHQDEGLAVLPLFLSVRAAILAMVLVQTANITGADQTTEPVRILNEALAFLSPPPASLILVGGLSGSGKSTLSHALAPLIGAAPGAVHLRSDLERKVMRGVSDKTPLGAPDYESAARAAVYDRLFARAGEILDAGHSVLLDATFLNPEDRRKAIDVGRKAKAKLQMLWLDAPLPVLIDRVRSRAGDASDADENVVRRQSSADTAPGDWQRISVTGHLDETIELAKAALHLNSET